VVGSPRMLVGDECTGNEFHQALKHLRQAQPSRTQEELRSERRTLGKSVKNALAPYWGESEAISLAENSGPKYTRTA